MTHALWLHLLQPAKVIHGMNGKPIFWLRFFATLLYSGLRKKKKKRKEIQAMDVLFILICLKETDSSAQIQGIRGAQFEKLLICALHLTS